MAGVKSKPRDKLVLQASSSAPAPVPVPVPVPVPATMPGYCAVPAYNAEGVVVMSDTLVVPGLHRGNAISASTV